MQRMFEGVMLDGTTIRYGETMGSVIGAKASVETDGEMIRRFTATRLILLGPLALAFRKKKDKRELYLMVEGKDFAFVAPCNPKKGLEARQFAAAINTAASQAEPQPS
jgi:hypothetical protein